MLACVLLFRKQFRVCAHRFYRTTLLSDGQPQMRLGSVIPNQARWSIAGLECHYAGALLWHAVAKILYCVFNLKNQCKDGDCFQVLLLFKNSRCVSIQSWHIWQMSWRILAGGGHRKGACLHCLCVPGLCRLWSLLPTPARSCGWFPTWPVRGILIQTPCPARLLGCGLASNLGSLSSCS